jgi:outer membrane usher protein
MQMTQDQFSGLRISPISLAITTLLLSGAACADPTAAGDMDAGGPVEFNETFLHATGGGTHADISRFSRGNQASPGTYRADLVINQDLVGIVDVTLRAVDAGLRDVQPCFDRALLSRIGVDLGKLTPQAAILMADGGRCTTLPELVEGATASFDNGEQRLYVSVPQASLSRQPRGYVDPQFWDDGVTGARLQYDANAYRSEMDGIGATQSYLGMDAGFNAGPWRLRHTGNLTHDSSAGSRYQSVRTYAQRSIPVLKSQLTIGDAYTDGAVFDSYGFRGMQLASDDRMFPESQRGYAPTVHGIANSNARVQIRQDGNVIYETTVAAGAFAIDDLYPTGYGGDLEVIVTEADGSVHVSRVPFASAVNALRPGVTRHAFTAGQYRNAVLAVTPYVFQGTLQHGFNNLLTGYGGVVASDNYSAAALGAALNTPLGAFGADITHARTGLRNRPDREGQSVRVSFSKLLTPTNTNITVAAYRYNSRGFLGLPDAIALRELDDRFSNVGDPAIQRGKLQLNLSQQLPGNGGSFYLSGFRQDYWNRRDTDTQYQAGYNNTFRRVNLGISASRQFELNLGKWDNQVMLTVGVPLGRSEHAPYSTTSAQRLASGATALQQSLTGSLGEDHAFSYGVNAGHTHGGGQNSISTVGANAAYASPVATVSASASRSGEYRQASAGISGGMVAYRHGLVFSPSLGDTTAIVEAPGARGARVVTGTGVRVDRWGHAVASSLQPFANNPIEIDPKGLPLNVEMKSTLQQATPTAGAISLVKFETASAGRAAILRARRENGAPVPFGAEVFDGAGQSIGTVAQAGRIIARRLSSDTGELTVRWGDDSMAACTLSYHLQPTDAATLYATDDVTCR